MKRKTTERISLIDLLVLIFSCALVIVGKLNAQVCENQVKQCAFSDHWKSIKKLFFGEKITGDDTQRQKDWLK